MKKWLYLIFLTSSLLSQIEIAPVGLYNLRKIGRKTYELKLNDKSQTFVRLTGKISDGGYQRVVWKTDKSTARMDLQKMSLRLSIHIHILNQMERSIQCSGLYLR